MSILRRSFLRRVVAGASLAWGSLGTLRAANRTDPGQQTSTPGSAVSENPSTGPDALFEKPATITMAELAQRETEGVAAVEVSDYTPGGFKGEMAPSPPHADLNPRKAVIAIYKDKPHRLVFCHEASYDHWIELPNGVGLCNQFFEGNNGWAELFNNNGRKERNSFVDIIQSGPERVWVRWNYFCVNQDDDTHPALRGTEDYFTYPNGLVWRRLSYSTLMPEKVEGYSWQPIDFFSVAPGGTTWSDLFAQDEEFGDYHVGAVIDAYSEKHYDKYWDEEGHARRNGDKLLLREIAQSRGFSMVVPFKAGHLFTVMGAASGFPSDKSQVVDHSFNDTGGWGWGAARWDHWPIGWLNSQTHNYKPDSPYPYHFGPFSHYIINKPIENAKEDFPVAVHDMDLNRWSERHVYYTLTGVAPNLDSIRRLAQQWLDKGNDCARPESIAGLSLPAMRPAS